jgi:predicted signal transduction protein with EAL and GGDEF domain
MSMSRSTDSAPAMRGEMAFLAYHDPLTGLANRAALELALEEAITAARVDGTVVALAFADLNEFKRVNDSLGHDMGDELLCQVAARLRTAVLRELPVQIIKVDRAFLRGVPADAQGRSVYSGILQLADACGCDVVAEGVEHADQAAFLIESGCRIAQGYHFSRPVAGPEMTALLQASIASDRRR